jgi:hypothetical protein
MQKLFGAKRKVRRVENDRKWWQFLKKSKVKPMRALDIQHHVEFNEGHYANNNNAEYFEMEKYNDRDNNHYRYDDEPNTLAAAAEIFS